MKKHLKTFRGFYIFIIAVIFNVVESLYFGQGTKLGFNRVPMSTGEMICDNIATILLFLGFFFTLFDNRHTVINNIETFNYSSDKTEIQQK